MLPNPFGEGSFGHTAVGESQNPDGHLSVTNVRYAALEGELTCADRLS
jgi:hypothetical protein